MATLTQPTQRRGKSVHSVNVNYDAVPVPVPSRSPSPTSSKRPATGGAGGDLSLKGISEDGRRSPIPGDVYGYPSSKVGCAPMRCCARTGAVSIRADQSVSVAQAHLEGDASPHASGLNSHVELFVYGAIVLLSAVVRFWMIHHPPSVV